MSKKIKEKIRENIVKPEVKKQKSTTIAEILKFNKEEKTAKIEYKDSTTGKTKQASSVPVTSDVIEGMDGKQLNEEDQVVIGFENSRDLRPYIIRKFHLDGNEVYKQSITEKGALISNANGYIG